MIGFLLPQQHHFSMLRKFRSFILARGLSMSAVFRAICCTPHIKAKR